MHYSPSKPEVLRGKMPETDIFTYDSHHIYPQMKLEFNQACPYLCPGGLLFNALWNVGLTKFAQATRVCDAQIFRGAGVMLTDWR